MNIDFPAQLLQELGQNLGINNLSFDENQCCHLTINQDTPVSIRRDDDRQCFVLLGAIAEKNTWPLTEDLMQLALRQNLLSLNNPGPTIGWDSKIGLIGYVFIAYEGVSIESLQSKIADLTDWLNSWPQALNPIKTDQNKETIPFDIMMKRV
ncbi:MAG: CesT family type III secretion system chaperone [Pseudomonadota bacterium]